MDEIRDLCLYDNTLLDDIIRGTDDDVVIRLPLQESMHPTVSLAVILEPTFLIKEQCCLGWIKFCFLSKYYWFRVG